jgi:hypothetical protein
MPTLTIGNTTLYGDAIAVRGVTKSRSGSNFPHTYSVDIQVARYAEDTIKNYTFTCSFQEYIFYKKCLHDPSLLFGKCAVGAR